MKQKIQYMPQEKIQKIQEALFKSTVDYLANHSDYYKRMFEANSINPSTINTLDDLQRIPITTKEDLLKYNDQSYCFGLSGAADVVSTSGSTGIRPIVHPLTQTDLHRLAYNEQMSFKIADMGSEERVMLNTVLDGSFVAGLAYYLGVKRIGSTVVRAGAKNWRLQLEILSNQNISTIIGVPSNLIKLRRYCAENNFDISKCNIKKLILIGESIRNKDFTLNQLGRRLLECYPQANFHSTYANTETCTSFCECEFGHGGHLLPDLAYVEIVDNDGRPLGKGEIGRLIITTFGGQGMPLLRYDTGDITFLCNEQCACGRTTPRIGPILSRNNNIIKIGGITFSQAQIENAILSIPQIDDYCIVVGRSEEGISTIQILYSLRVYLDGFDENILKRKIWNLVRVNPELKCCSLEKLEEAQTVNRLRKTQRFINEAMQGDQIG